MNKLITCALALFLAIMTTQARTLRVVYIAHDVDTPVEQLVKKIENYYENLEDEAYDEESIDQTILYLSSGSNPVIANMKSGSRDDEQFNRIISELYERNFHDVDTDVDIDNVIDLLDKSDFLSPAGQLDVSQLKFEFYITPSFWTMRQNEKFIASLYYILGLQRFCNSNSPEYTRSVSFTTFFPTIPDMRQCVGEEGKPFGIENVNNINNIVSDFIGKY